MAFYRKLNCPEFWGGYLTLDHKYTVKSSPTIIYLKFFSETLFCFGKHTTFVRLISCKLFKILTSNKKIVVAFFRAKISLNILFKNNFDLMLKNSKI